MNISPKPFKSWREQIDILNEWGNDFLKHNKIEKKKILEYLKNYNFQVFVDGFAPLLWQNFEDGINETNLKFIKNFKFDDLIELFNFDSSLKSTINIKLQDLEKRLRTAIIYHTLEELNKINKDIINLPFILLDDKFSKDIALKLFVNNLSKESFFDENNEFDFKSYFNFVIRYINPFDTFNSYSINMDVKKFYFHKILKNNIQLKLERKILKQQFDEFNRNGSVPDSLLLQIKNELNNKKIDCSFIQLFNYLNEKEFKNIKDNSVRTNIVIDNGINILSKSFIPLYKSLTQQSFGDLINFFCKLNENIQIKIIKKHFSCFYKKIYKLQNQNNKFCLILISSFISFLILFKNLRNKIAHCDIIYNFWDIYTPICNNNQRKVKSKKKDFWLLNKDSCTFLNNILNNKKKRFLSNYFLSFENKSIDYYLDKLNSLELKLFCKMEEENITLVKKNKYDNNIWHIPLFSLANSFNWLCIFINDKDNFTSLLNNQIFKQNKITNNEIKKRLLDFLLNDIIINFEKLENNEINY